MPRFTVFTPTFNRAYILHVLYQSLCAQTCKDFEWLIVDDGSTDDTETLVALWKQENADFPIFYFKKENGGKPRAINYGIQRANGRYFILMDSDDHLTPDAIEKFDGWADEIDEDTSFIGVGAARGYPNGTYIKGTPPKVNEQGYVDATNLQRSWFDLDADMVEAYKTEVLKKFPMAEWPGERFAPEQIALNEIALAGYKLRWHKDIIYICDYLQDGLTKGSRRLEKNNPMGYAMMYNHKLRYPISAKEKFHAACQHVALSVYAGHPGYIWKTNRPGYTIPALPFGLLLALRRKKQYQNI